MAKRDKPAPSCFSRAPELNIKDAYQMILRWLLKHHLAGAPLIALAALVLVEA